MRQEKIAVSLNIKAVKKHNPSCDTGRIYELLEKNPMKEFRQIIAMETASEIDDEQISEPMLYQRIHFKLIDATQRIAFLEKMLKEQK